MDWIKRMSLKKALFTITFIGLFIATILSFSIFYGCIQLRDKIAPSSITLQLNETQLTTIIDLNEPSARAMTIFCWIELMQIVLPIMLFISIMMMTTSLFYRLKLKEPLQILKFGTEQIQVNNLEFNLKKFNYQDELTEVCLAFDKMRQTLYNNHQIFWRETEERKRLSAVFAHDLRNPVTVLKGTIKQLQKNKKQDLEEQNALKRLETYTMRIERYIEAMSHIQKLEQLSLKMEQVICTMLEQDIKNTIELLDSTIIYHLIVPREKIIILDYNLFMRVTENLLNNAIRFANNEITIIIEIKDNFLSLIVSDDGKGYPMDLIRNGPKPFKQFQETVHHFGIGLYSCELLCQKHGGSLELMNNQGAKATATFKIEVIAL